MNLMNRAIYQKDKEYRTARNSGADPIRIAAIHNQPCCICYEYGLTQNSLTQAHHCIHGRGGSRRTPDSMAIPLCEGHHQGLRDTTKVALHQSPKQWRAEYGPDTDWISWTEQRITQ